MDGPRTGHLCCWSNYQWLSASSGPPCRVTTTNLPATRRFEVGWYPSGTSLKKGSADFGVQLQGCNSGHGLVPWPNSLHSEQSLADRRSSCVTSFRVPMRTKNKKKNKAEYSCLSLFAEQVCTFSQFPQVGYQRACGLQRLNNKFRVRSDLAHHRPVQKNSYHHSTP